MTKPENTTSPTPQGVDPGITDWAESVLKFGAKALNQGFQFPHEVIDDVKNTYTGVQSLVGTFATEATMKFYEPLDIFGVTDLGDGKKFHHSEALLDLMRASKDVFYKSTTQANGYIVDLLDSPADLDYETRENAWKHFPEKIITLAGQGIKFAEDAERLVSKAGPIVGLTLPSMSGAAAAKSFLEHFKAIEEKLPTDLPNFVVAPLDKFNFFGGMDVLSALLDEPVTFAHYFDTDKILNELKDAYEAANAKVALAEKQVSDGSGDVPLITTISGLSAGLIGVSLARAALSNIERNATWFKDSVLSVLECVPITVGVEGGCSIGAEVEISVHAVEIMPLVVNVVNSALECIRNIIATLYDVLDVIEAILNAGKDIASVALG